MHYETLEANIYAKPIDERVTPRDTLDVPKKVVQQGFSKIGKDAQLDIDWKDHDWPEPASGYKGMVIDDPLSQYRELQAIGHDADVNVLLAKNLHQFGPELGILLTRKRAALHTFIISLESLPDRIKEGGVFRGIACVPLPGKEERYYLHTKAEEAGPADEKNIEQRGYLSFHSYEKLSRFRIQNLLALTYLRKPAN